MAPNSSRGMTHSPSWVCESRRSTRPRGTHALASITLPTRPQAGRQCPATCHGGAIRPARRCAPSCRTRYLGSLRSVLTKQFGYPTGLLLSSEAGSRELSGASPRRVASLAAIANHRRPCTDCGHIALPIVLIGVPFVVVASRSLLGPPS